MLSELIESNDIQNCAEALNHRLDEDGYLFFRELLDPARLLSLRREMLTVMQAGGWLVGGTDPVDGIADPAARSTEGDLEYTDVYHEVYRLQSFHEIGHSREVLDLLERIRGCEMLSQPQKVCSALVSEVHRTHDASSSGLCPLSGHARKPDLLESHWRLSAGTRRIGGLAVLRGFHKVNHVLDHHFSLGAGSLFT